MGYPKAELSLVFTDDEHIAELNRRYLDRNGPTNVLAFPMTDATEPEPHTPMLGDIVISLDTAMRDAQGLRESFEGTVDRLLIHGLLHLLGYEHEESVQEAQRMEKETERLLELVANSGSGITELDNG